MRVPLSWLRELVDVEASTEELADRLSMTGTVVDRIERFAPGVSGIVAGSVLDVSDVPSSDRLCVAHVDVGSQGSVQVVAGVRNFAKGDKVPVALPGATVTTLDQPVGTRKMLSGRYESQGMLCSALELGLSEDHSGIVVLDPDVEAGTDVVGLLGLDDAVLELEIYPNRPDLMSIVGVAREAALLYGSQLRLPSASVSEEGGRASALTSVTIEDTAGCPRYLARVIEDVVIGPAPALVQARLTACGFRPLGNIVDATNYVLLLTGQPLHAFDLDRLGEERIVVRWARPGERLVTIDSEERALDPDDLVIADGTDAQAIAGVMGGAPTEVGAWTRRVLLESAYFDPLTIARTARRRHMRTEASARFERGADPEAVPVAAALAAEHMRRWAGGRVAKGAVDEGEAPPRRRIVLRPARVEEILAVDVPPERSEAYLGGLGCRVRRGKQRLEVEAPSWRPDLDREIDLIEEIARLYGFENIPTRHRAGHRGARTRMQVLRERVRDTLLGAGLNEATLSSFAPEEDLAAVGYDGPVVRVSNPITVDQGRLRPSLISGLLRAAQRNVAHGVRGVRLFEMGTIFSDWPQGADLPEQSEHVVVLVAADRNERERPIDALDVKGMLELVLTEIGVGGWTLQPGGEMPFHPGRAASVVIDGERVGGFGEIRPSVARAFDLEGPVAVGGLALEPLFARAPRERKIRPLPAQPPVLRDISMALSVEVPAGEVEQTIRAAGGEYLESVTLLDVYHGEQVGEGRRSLAYRLTFRALDRTLTAQEADAARRAIAEACRDRLGAEIR